MTIHPCLSKSLALAALFVTSLPIGAARAGMARGDHWGLLVLPPQELPVAADEVAVLRAATGLEQPSRFQAAATAYATIAERSPDSLEAWIGLGNSAYAAGDWSRPSTRSGRRPGAIRMRRRHGTILLTSSEKPGGGRKPWRPRSGRSAWAGPTRRPIARPCARSRAADAPAAQPPARSACRARHPPRGR
jgi:hypothetical protein